MEKIEDRISELINDKKKRKKAALASKLQGVFGGALMASIPTYLAFTKYGAMEIIFNDNPIEMKIVSAVSLPVYLLAIAKGFWLPLAIYRRTNRIEKEYESLANLNLQSNQ